jgi:glutathione S-transferase
MSEPYALYYWPTIQGRGEFVRLALEDAGVEYIDVARLSEREGGGVKAMLRVLSDHSVAHPPFAPPVLRAGNQWISQTANILQYMGPRLGLAPTGEADRVFANGLQLTLADLVVEAHDVHHPVGVSLYYDEQRPEALRRAPLFLAERMPKFLGYFERVLANNAASGSRYLVGERHSYVDLSMFQVLSGLAYAFPNAFRRLEPTVPNLAALRERVASRPRIAAYLSSPRRIPFNEEGIFRSYPELDPESD